MLLLLAVAEDDDRKNREWLHMISPKYRWSVMHTTKDTIQHI